MLSKDLHARYLSLLLLSEFKICSVPIIYSAVIGTILTAAWTWWQQFNIKYNVRIWQMPINIWFKIESWSEVFVFLYYKFETHGSSSINWTWKAMKGFHVFLMVYDVINLLNSILVLLVSLLCYVRIVHELNSYILNLRAYSLLHFSMEHLG